jgi:hypothetical protein
VRAKAAENDAARQKFDAPQRRNRHSEERPFRFVEDMQKPHNGAAWAALVFKNRPAYLRRIEPDARKSCTL